jgi:hypothetical protein
MSALPDDHMQIGACFINHIVNSYMRVNAQYGYNFMCTGNLLVITWNLVMKTIV